MLRAAGQAYGVEVALSGPVRLPAASRLQKIHNVAMAVAAMAAAGVASLTDPSRQHATARKLVDLDGKAALSCLWAFAEDVVSPALAPPARLLREIRRVEQAALPLDGAGGTRQLLLRWAAAVCARRGVRVSDLAASLADGSALCAILSHYLPTLLPVTPAGAARPPARELFAAAAASLGHVPPLFGAGWPSCERAAALGRAALDAGDLGEIWGRSGEIAP